METAVAYSPLITKPCPVCGKEFTSYKSVKSVGQKCCSLKCSVLNRKRTVHCRYCKQCKKRFPTCNPKRKYCGHECYAIAKRR